MTEEMERLFKQCEGVEDYSGVCLYVPPGTPFPHPLLNVVCWWLIGQDPLTVGEISFPYFSQQ